MATSLTIRTPRVNQVTGLTVTAAMKVHSLLGPGLLESAYQACLAHELRKQGLRVLTEVELPVVYDGEEIELGYRLDLVVEDLVVVEVKCVEAIHRVHHAQLLSYMRLSGKHVGLLINFHVAHLRDGTSAWSMAGTGKGSRERDSNSPVVLCALCGKAFRQFPQTPPPHKISQNISCICGNLP